MAITLEIRSVRGGWELWAHENGEVSLLDGDLLEVNIASGQEEYGCISSREYSLLLEWALHNYYTYTTRCIRTTPEETVAIWEFK